MSLQLLPAERVPNGLLAFSESVKSMTSQIYMYRGKHEAPEGPFKYFIQPSPVPEDSQL